MLVLFYGLWLYYRSVATATVTTVSQLRKPFFVKNFLVIMLKVIFIVTVKVIFIFIFIFVFVLVLVFVSFIFVFIFFVFLVAAGFPPTFMFFTCPLDVLCRTIL